MPVTALTQNTLFPASGGGHIVGPFGMGMRQVFRSNGEFVAPFDGLYRVRMWGKKGSDSSHYNDRYRGGGGGFVLKTIELKKGQAVPVTLMGSASFGNYCTAEQGGNANAETKVRGAGGRALGGDINVNGAYGSAVVNSSSWPPNPNPVGLKDAFGLFNSPAEIAEFKYDLDYLEVENGLGTTGGARLIVEY